MPRSFPDMLRSQLEPSVAETMGTDAWGLPEADRAVAISQAISLRRIADALGFDRGNGGQAGEEHVVGTLLAFGWPLSDG